MTWTSTLAVARPEVVGRVRQAVGLSVEVEGLDLAIGDLVQLGDGPVGSGSHMPAEVVAATAGAARCMPLAPPHGLRAGLEARATGGSLRVPVGPDSRVGFPPDFWN